MRIRIKDLKKSIRNKVKILDDISFDVDDGEIVGIIGDNGSGKTTLLRVIAGIYTKDSGEIITKGNITYLNGFNQALQKRLTMKENIHNVSTLMGIKREKIKEIMEEVIEFSGLNEHINKKVETFSRGMLTRLSFSIITHCIEEKKPEILLIDEALGGGDFSFQKKCMEKITSLIESDSSILFVSHNLNKVETYCKRTIWIEDGKIKKIGITKNIIEEYKNEATP
jgi:ABC-type polysaccharide/polyol phosphate transport system ATPase subunit